MSTMLDNMSAEQEKQLRKHLKDWCDFELETSSALRPAAEQSIKDCYSIAGLAIPEIYWCTSPLAIGLVKELLLVLNYCRSNPIESLLDPRSASAFFRTSNLGESLRTKIRDEAVETSASVIVENTSVDFRYKLWTNQSDTVSAAPFFKFKLHLDPKNIVQYRESSNISLQNTWIVGAISDSISSFRTRSQYTVPQSVWTSAWNTVEAAFGPVDEDRKREIEQKLYELEPFQRLGEELRRQSGFGQLDSRLLVIPAFVRSVCNLRDETENIKGLIGLAQSAGWYLPYPKVCLLSERQTNISLDLWRRPHNESGPAIVFPDDWKIYCWHGIIVSEKVIERPHELTIGEINSEHSTERRRVMIQRFGAEKYLKTVGMEVIDDDSQFGTLYKNIGPGEEMVMVRVINSTPESDGTQKEYFLRVPPNITTARQAVAWTFNMEDRDYRPDKET